MYDLNNPRILNVFNEYFDLKYLHHDCHSNCISVKASSSCRQ